MVKLSNYLKAFISCYFILLQVSPGLTQALEKSVVQVTVANKYVCAGTLVADKFVVTAAHCVQNAFGKEVNVIRPAISPAPEDKVKVDNIFTPPNFNPMTRDMNVAVLKLAKPIDPKTKVEKATLCDQSWGHNDTLTTYVWTVDKKTGNAGELKNFPAKVYGRNKCHSAYPDRFNMDHMFCGYNPGKTICFRDRGGPVEVKGQFCGIISFGHLCFNEAKPEVFTNVGNPDVQLFILKTLAGL